LRISNTRADQKRVEKNLMSRLVELGFEEEDEFSIDDWVVVTVDAMEAAAAKKRASLVD
jgi:hypothetical protein